MAPTPPQVVHLSERFRVERGLITEIEAIFSVNAIQSSGFSVISPDDDAAALRNGADGADDAGDVESETS